MSLCCFKLYKMAINLVVTIINIRSPGLTFERLPLFVWAIFITAWLLIFSLPILAGVCAPALNLAICWNNSEILSLSAGNLYSQENSGILRDYTPEFINYKEKHPFGLPYFCLPVVGADKRYFDQSLFESFKSEARQRFNTDFCFYLAGLIEGDGTFIVPKTDRSLKGRINYPSIQICFDVRDLPLAILIQKTLGFGSLNKKKGINAYYLSIDSYEGLTKMIIILNGKLKTVKIHDFIKLITFLNHRFDSLNIEPSLVKDNSLFLSNPWLSGFIDADGSFYARLQKASCSCGFVLVQAITDHNNRSKELIMLDIAKFLNVKLTIANKDYCNGKNQFSQNASSSSSNQTLQDYLQRWPLFSSKFQNFEDYTKLFMLKQFKKTQQRKRYTQEELSFISEISQGMNNKRTNFNWDHLQNFYL